MSEQTQTSAQNTAPQPQAQKGNPPVSTHRLGDVSVKIWENHDKENNAYYSVTFQKTYTDRKTGERRETRNFKSDDMYKIPELAEKAQDSVRYFQQQNRDRAKVQQQEQGQPEQAQQQAPLEQSQQSPAQPQQDLRQQQEAAMAQAAPQQEQAQPGPEHVQSNPGPSH